MGLPGLCATLQYFTNNKFASEEILEIRINNLIEEAKKIIPLESHPASTRPSPRRQDNTVLTQCMLPSLQPGTKHLPFLLDSDEDSDSPPQIIDNKHPCQGVRINVPEGRSPFLEWPWKEQVELAMAWDIHIKNGILTLHAPTCLQLTLRDRIHRGIPETTPYKYLGTSGLIEILRRKDRQIDSLKLQCLNTNWKLDLLMTSNLDYKRFVMAVGECNVPCLNQLVCPRCTEQEHLMSVVLYWLGGAHVAEFAHAALGMPGIATTRQHCTTSIRASPAFPTLDEMRSNITTAYQIDAPSNNQVVSLVCMIDEIKVEEVLDWCLHTNRCNEHAINNIGDAHTLFDDLANRKVHFGMELPQLELSLGIIMSESAHLFVV
ncbi:uncharacterized protein EI90DRAFT_3018003 [Cantharellus anzutake]|uniref:uncharacterized protein n=1 Tax=Cantharellus anzutake TaxID=1750568 RepID=UPI001907A053|nr:uncharacterized protein EI90DRAFT_3018003 [Cantharellus anzutake]KAF8327756.1 hypothetical protein EI90DRAFT_3018003 [Cantharellus anzutake]